MTAPNRWLHLRHADGFDDEMFGLFAAQCRVWRAYVEAVLADWAILQPGSATAPRYHFFEPTRSADNRQVDLPVGGDYTLGSRVLFENSASRLLSEFLPLHFRLKVDEGLTETLSQERGPETFWRPALRA